MLNNSAFTLYGLIGCPHCELAENFLRVRNMPGIIIPADGDPIIAAGVKELTGGNEYPVLVSRLTNEVIKGFVPETYERLAKLYFESISGSTQSIFSGGQQPVPEAPKQAKAASAG